MASDQQAINTIDLVVRRGDGKEFTVIEGIDRYPSGDFRMVCQLVMRLDEAVEKCGRYNHENFRWSTT